MPGVLFLEGERVELRTVEQDDAEVIQRARNEPNFQEGFVIESPKNRNTVEEYIQQNIEGNDNCISLLTCVDGESIGVVSLLDMRRAHGMLHYWLFPEARGNGYATEASALLLDHAFGTIGLHRVFAWTIDANEASQNVLRRLGFTHEGTYREHVFKNGSYRDTEHYGLLESEWESTEVALESR